MEKDTGSERLKFRIPPIYYLIVITLIIIMGWIIVISLGWVTVDNILVDFIGFISMLVVIFMLAVLGAVFLGMFISHKILSSKGFTPFEREMMEMREDIAKMSDKIANIEQRLTDDPEQKNK